MVKQEKSSFYYEVIKNKSFKQTIIDALETDGGHHKQWYLELLLVKLGFDFETVRKEEQGKGHDWEPGIPD